MSHNYNDSAHRSTNTIYKRSRMIEVNLFYLITFVVTVFALLTGSLALFVIKHQLALVTLSTLASGIAYITLCLGISVEKGDINHE